MSLLSIVILLTHDHSYFRFTLQLLLHRLQLQEPASSLQESVQEEGWQVRHLGSTSEG